jgi:RimJ/RimL family protein N-acetyltransferase
LDNAHEDHRDVVRMAIEADQQYIGHCSLTGLRDLHGNLELGIVIGDREYWSKGYGRGGCRSSPRLRVPGAWCTQIALTTHEDNPRAIRCYAACGFIEEGRPRQAFWSGRRYADLVEMSILRDEWMAAPSSSDGKGG